MAEETVMVRPRDGLILDGIPREGATIPKALADEWLADRLVVRVETVDLTPPKLIGPPVPIEKPARRVVKPRQVRRTKRTTTKRSATRG